MAHAPDSVIRPDIDIEADIHNMLKYYKPLMHDRHRLQFTVQDGHVTVSGHVKAPSTYRILLDNLPHVDGVKSVDHAALHDDESIRFDAGRVVPAGVMVTIDYGAVILSGELPEGIHLEDVVRQIGQVPGVNRVITTFQSA